MSIIKEVAGDPTSAVADDKTLGVQSFQEKYFNDYPVYLNAGRDFYHALGGRSLISQPLFSWNPFELWAGWTNMKKRLEDKKIGGNMVGEGLLQGGVMILSPTTDAAGWAKVEYVYQEQTGSELPMEDIIAASLRACGSSTATAGSFIKTSTGTGCECESAT